MGGSIWAEEKESEDVWEGAHSEVMQTVRARTPRAAPSSRHSCVDFLERKQRQAKNSKDELSAAVNAARVTST